MFGITFMPSYALDFLIEGVYDMALNLENLQREVVEMESVVDSAMTLMTELAAEVRANVTDQTALNELADRLDRNAQALAESVAANTDSEDELPEEEPTPITE